MAISNGHGQSKGSGAVPCIIPFREFPQKRLQKPENISRLNPSWKRLAELEGQLGAVSPRGPVGSGFLCWDKDMLEAGMGAVGSGEVGQDPLWRPMVLHNLGLNESTENSKPAPQKRLSD